MFMQSKSKIQKNSYLPRINLSESVNEAKQQLSMQREHFYFTVLRFYPFLRTFYSNVHNTPFNNDLKTDMPLFTETLSLQ